MSLLLYIPHFFIIVNERMQYAKLTHLGHHLESHYLDTSELIWHFQYYNFTFFSLGMLEILYVYDYVLVK